MLTIHGTKHRYCDGVTRRGFLKIGAFSFGAAHLTLADILRAEAKTNRASSHKAVINVFLGGGPPHQDMWEIKTEAPVDIRGEFQPINTNVTGIQIGECFPKIAAMADKFAFLRSIVGARGGHDAIQCMSGRSDTEFKSVGGWPSMGAILSKLYGPVDPSVPPFVGLAAKTTHMPWSDCGKAGFLGSANGAFKPEGPDMANMKLNGITSNQLDDRKRLLSSFDQIKRDIDTSGSLRGADAATERALGVLTSSKLLDRSGSILAIRCPRTLYSRTNWSTRSCILASHSTSGAGSVELLSIVELTSCCSANNASDCAASENSSK